MISTAETYFKNHLMGSVWNDALEEEKAAALSQAQVQINALGVSCRLSGEDYRHSVFEQALFLLSLKDEGRQRLNLQSQNVSSVKIGDVTENYREGSLLAPFVRQTIKKYQYRTGELI